MRLTQPGIGSSPRSGLRRSTALLIPTLKAIGGHQEGRLASSWRMSSPPPKNGQLGVRRDGRMHIRFSAGHEYLTGFPVSATCRGCGTLNRVAS